MSDFQQEPERRRWDLLAEVGRELAAVRRRLEQLEGLRSPKEPAAAETPGPMVLRDVGEPLSESQESVLASLKEVVSIPSTGLDANEVFGLAMDRITRLLSVDRAVLFLLDIDDGRLRPRASRGFRRDDLSEFALLPGEGLAGRAFREARPLLYTGSLAESSADPFISRFPVRDAIALPVRAENEVVGALYVGRHGRPAPFAADEIQLLVVIVDRIGTALVHRRLVDKVSGQVDRLRELVALAVRSSLRHGLGENLSAACEAGCRLLGVRSAVLVVVGPDGELAVRGSYGIPEELRRKWHPCATEGVTKEVFAGQRLVVCPDLARRPGSADSFLVGLGMRSLVLVPVRARERLVGCLYLGESRVRDFSADECGAAQLLGTLVGMAIDNAELFGELSHAHETLKAAQERLVESEKLRALGAMAGGVAHEFNNILAIILGKAQLMLERAPEVPLRDDLGIIEEAGWRAADLVRRLQSFSGTQVEAGISRVDLNRLIEDAVALTRSRWKDEAQARGIQVEVVTDLEETLPVPGSQPDLREMLTNLLLNAVDALPRGGRIGISTRNQAGALEFVVTDTGVGMAEEIQRRVFEPFFTTRSPERAGLGLSVVHGIVVRHGGKIRIDSREGRGTTVRISLPTTRAVPQTPPFAPPSGEPAPGVASVLVIEDEDRLRRMLIDILESAGHAVEGAVDGLDGLARFEGGQFDVVVTDLSMPECSGLEVARAVKKFRPGTPVVLITGWGDLVDPTRIQEAGVDLVLVKPFRVERVLNVVTEALKLRRPANR